MTMNKVDIVFVTVVVLVIIFVSFLVGRDINREDWCKDKGGVYISSKCVDKSVVIELEQKESK